jgi:hypothetical protein
VYKQRATWQMFFCTLTLSISGFYPHPKPYEYPMISFEYAPSYYRYVETVLSDASDSQEVYMTLTSAPVAHKLTAIMKRYLSYDWYNQTDTSFILGNVDYTSSNAGSVSGQDNLIFVLQTTLNHCWANAYCVGLGYGFRYLDNDSRHSITTTGNFGYERENYLHYLPIVLTAERLFHNQRFNRFQLQTKGYYLLDGNQISKYSKLGCESDMHNRQNTGYGAEIIARLYANDRKWYYGIGAQYWQIEASDTVRIPCFDGNHYGNEPDNTTTMISAVIGYIVH